MQTVVQNSFVQKRHVLPINNAGLYKKIDAAKPEEAIQPLPEGKAEFLPIQDINVDAKIYDSVATVKITQNFVNPSKIDPQNLEESADEKPIEVSYKFPKIADQIIAGMKVSIGDKTIEANIQEKEKAQDKYDNSVSSGNQAAIMKETKGEFLELQIGNIKPRQTATIEITIIQHLQSSNGAFDFELPLTYFPQFVISKKDMNENDKINFNFKASLQLTQGGFSEIAHPQNFEILNQKVESATIQKTDSNYLEVKEDLKISFRLQNSNDTRLMFQKSDKYPNQVAVMASFLPTFTQESSEKTQFTEGELEEQDLPKELESNYEYIFLIDRSGSMGCHNRMQIANDAVILFLQSLPAGCKFGMLGFGSDSRWCAGEINSYDNQTKERAIDEARYFDSDYGGTDILSPLVTAATLDSGSFKKRIFILTDGQVGNKQDIINYCSSMCEKNDDTKVFTFGIGNGCDKDLVQRVAEAGRGTSSIVEDNNPQDLKEKVVNALRKASDPALQNCSLKLGDDKFTLGNLFRNQPVRCYKFFSDTDFENIQCKFNCEFDPKTKGSLSQSWSLDSFNELTSGDDSLFKLCAKSEIEKQTSIQQKVSLSLKYQVLCKETAFIGVIKNKDKVDDEMQKVEIQSIDYSQIVKQKQQQASFKGYGGFGGSAMSSAPKMRIGGFGGSAMSAAPNMSFGGFGGSAMSAAPQRESAAMCKPKKSKKQARPQQQMSMMAAPCDSAPPQKQQMSMMAASRGSARPQQQQMPMMAAPGSSAPRQQMKMQAAPAQKQSYQGPIASMFSMFGGSKGSAMKAPSQQLMSRKASPPTYDSQVYGSMKAGKNAQMAMDNYMECDNLQDLMDDMQDMQASNNDISDFFKDLAPQKSQKDELEEMMAEEESEQMMDLCSAPQMSMAPACSMAMAAPARSVKVRPPKTKPSLQTLINAQDSNGFWNSSSTSMILQFLCNESEVKSFLNNNKDITEVVLTFLAINILEQQFQYKKAEWDMICSKAKKWIRQRNIDADRKKRLENASKEHAAATDQYDDQVDLEALNEENELAALMAL